MKRQIVYLMSGPAHLPYLVCSLHTLRKWWISDVVVHVWPESFDIVQRMAKDKSLGIKYQIRNPDYRKKNAQFLDKIRLMQTPGYSETLYLDADTTIHGELVPLFSHVAEYGFVATQFNEWITTGGIIKRRVKRLQQFPDIDQELVEKCLIERWPSVNGGVFACRPDSPVLPLWEEWTTKALSVFIADETVLHLMQLKFYPNRQFFTKLGGAYNCSPIKRFQPKNLPADGIVVQHYHGDSNVRLDKSQNGFDRWWPIYQECLQKNVGGIREWIGSIDNKWMNKLKDGLK